MSDVPITVAHGDGIGPEIMDAVLFMLREGGARLAPETIQIGQACYEAGHPAGIAPESWESLRRTRVFLKSPITTPQGGGFKSLNVTIRKTLALFANVRPNVAYAPFVETKHPDMDVTIVRENEEDLYAGIEHQQTPQVVQCLKLITRPGTERICRYAFEYARANGRKRVTCMSKDNIMKYTDGLFHGVFDEIAADYPDIEADHKIIDIGTALLADQPERFDVIVTTNLYGDILSDVAAQIAGSVGMNGSSNIGEACAMFEAIHGSAPDIAGQGIANPSGLLYGALMMLQHIGQGDVAKTLHGAWLKTLEDGIHTGDIASEGHTKEKVGTRGFAEAVVARLGQEPSTLRVPAYGKSFPVPQPKPTPEVKKDLVGVDVFIDWKPGAPDDLGGQLQKLQGEALELVMITNRGVKVWPDGLPETFCTDHWRCRFQTPDGKPTRNGEIIALLQRIEDGGLDFIKTEHLYEFDGKRGYSLGQGQRAK
ncbi:MAG TPA: NADP-dependent isocitrate dehydrogenase [Polyangiaceae bacterium LLY-WYZ-15_(1-7)]|nr:isocitrate dehydrogenase [Sandaracinus sp.]HJK90110.1 NADP-dependent isocitrate dehydrogenase [Polyangiaceae bacterium LLY-WYZ-15_(1-7)]MBJ73161.1 isocitrate dehydrogenase [Sandaracinus sp.]HJL06309.1 NADP-dependent isocitrate dehydrogenase [Polyangiaceae bacterium LLY-WYZ-15_(1-7)]HJL10796.1 NADP-dependent isocitrate dehydrogenase [Polyangiaceae bacterium LLY-WYZ-15_(1-7)]